jgi:hypothetical protein
MSDNPLPAAAFAPLADLLGGLPLRLCDVEINFSRPALIQRLSTATIRGLFGKLLLQMHPVAAGRLFKPGGNQPAALLFQPLHDREHRADSLHFRLISWDREVPALAEKVLANMAGAPFGLADGPRVTGACIHEVCDLQFDPVPGDLPHAIVELVTPLHIRRAHRMVTERELDLHCMIVTIVRRINQLSIYYGNKLQLDDSEYDFLASGTVEAGRQLETEHHYRVSGVQQQPILLAGMTGRLAYEVLPAPLADLINTASLVHIGHHTMEGCGRIALAD